MDVPGGRVAYVVMGQGPLIVPSHGIGDLRQSYRFLAPLLIKAAPLTRFARQAGRAHAAQAGVEICSMTTTARPQGKLGLTPFATADVTPVTA